jgi:hypothetical protein
VRRPASTRHPPGKDGRPTSKLGFTHISVLVRNSVIIGSIRKRSDAVGNTLGKDRRTLAFFTPALAVKYAPQTPASKHGKHVQCATTLRQRCDFKRCVSFSDIKHD